MVSKMGVCVCCVMLSIEQKKGVYKIETEYERLQSFGNDYANNHACNAPVMAAIDLTLFK